MLIPYHQLQKRFHVNANGVMHIGANVGEEMEAYYQGGVQKVVWVEANPELLPQLQQNTKQYEGYVDITSLNVCLGDRDEKVTLHISNNAGQSSSLLDLGYHKKAHPEVRYTHDIAVQMRRYDDYFSADPDILAGLDFLNCDIQGSELMALRGMGEMVRQFKWIYLEVNRKELYVGCPMVEEIDEYMAGFGFKRVVTEWTTAGWGDALMVRK